MNPKTNNAHHTSTETPPTNILKAILSKLVYWVLVIYYALQSPSFPTKDKAKIVGALLYLISPIDLIPDVIPVVGILDDAALLFALFRLFVTIDSNIIEQARDKTTQWFK